MNKTAKIYSLINPLDGKVFYIGVTIRTLRERLNRHCASLGYSLNCGILKQRVEFIETIIRKGSRPVINLLEEVDVMEAEDKERAYYLKYKSDGYTLLQSERQFKCYSRQIDRFINK